MDPTMEIITYSFVLYLQHGRYDVKCKPSIATSFVMNSLTIFKKMKLFQKSCIVISHVVLFATPTSVAEVHKKTGAELVSNGIVGRNLGTAPFVSFPNSAPQNHWIRVWHQSFYELRKR